MILNLYSSFATSDSTPISLQQAIERALEFQPIVKKGREKVFELHYKAEETWLDFLPHISVEGRHIYFKDENLFDVGLRLRYPLFEGGRVYYGYNKNKHQKQAAEVNVAILEQDLIKNVKVAYVNLLLQGWLLKTRHNLRKRLLALHALTLDLIKNGTASPSQSLRVKAQLLQSEADITEHDKYVDIAKSVLLHLLNQEQTDRITPVERVRHFIPSHYTLEQVLNAALDRAEFEHYEHQKLSLEHAINEAESAYWPRLNVDAVYGLSNYPMGHRMIDAPAVGDFEPLWGVGLSIELDFFSWAKARKKSQVASSHLKQLRLEEEQFQNDLSFQVKKAYIAWRAAKTHVKIAQELYATSAQSYQEILEEYKNGVETLESVLETLQMLVRSRADYLSAFYGVYMTEAYLEREIGWHNYESP